MIKASSSWLALAGAGALLLLVVLQNLFGSQLLELTLLLPGIDKLLHVIEYLLAFTILHKLAELAGLTGHKRIWLALAAAISLAIVDEALQQLAPLRNVELLDLAADLCGITAGAALLGAVGLRRLAIAGMALTCGMSVAFNGHVRTRDFARGLRAEREHDFRAARIHYRRAIETGSRTASLYNNLGWVEIESGEGDVAEAVGYAATALSMSPENPDILDTYGWALHHAGRHTEALRYLLQAYEKNPSIFCIHYHLGATYRALGDRDKAVFHFSRQTERSETREAVLAVRALADLRPQP